MTVWVEFLLVVLCRVYLELGIIWYLIVNCIAYISYKIWFIYIFIDIFQFNRKNWYLKYTQTILIFEIHSNHIDIWSTLFLPVLIFEIHSTYFIPLRHWNLPMYYYLNPNRISAGHLPSPNIVSIHIFINVSKVQHLTKTFQSRSSR